MVSSTSWIYTLINGQSRYRIGLLWVLSAWVGLLVMLCGGFMGKWSTTDVFGTVVVAFFFLMMLTYRVCIDVDGFSVDYFPINLFLHAQKIPWSSVVEIRRWEFVAFEESWGIHLIVRKPSGKLRWAGIPGIVQDMPGLLKMVLEKIPPSTIVDPMVMQRLQRSKSCRNRPAIRVLARVGILVLVALTLFIGTASLFWLQGPLAKALSFSISIAFVAFLGSRIYEFR